MPASCKRQVQDVQNPFATTMAGRRPDRALPPARRARALLEHAVDAVSDAAPTAATNNNRPLGAGNSAGRRPGEEQNRGEDLVAMAVNPCTFTSELLIGIGTAQNCSRHRLGHSLKVQR